MRDSVEFYTFYSIENGSKKALKMLVWNATFDSNFHSKLYSNQSPEFYLKKQLDFEPFFRVEIKPNILHYITTSMEFPFSTNQNARLLCIISLIYV